MKSRTPLIALLAVATVATLGWLWSKQRASTAQQLARAEPAAKPSIAELPAGPTQNKVPEKPAALSPARDTQRTVSSSQPATPANPKEEARRKAYTESTLSAIERQYPPLFRRLQLSPEKLTTFKSLMLELRLASYDEARRRAANGSSIAPQDSLRVTKELQQPIYDDIRALLGDDAYALYTEYNESLTERTELGRITKNLTAPGEVLSETQFELLVSTLAKLTAEVRAAHNGVIPLGESPDQVAARFSATLDSVRSSLTPEQTAALQRAFATEISDRKTRPRLG